MKQIITFIFSGLIFGAQSQQSHELIPTDAVTVFSIDNFSLLQKVSLDELVSYQFMEELQQELFDGSTNGKTIKDAGIDFDQKLNVFYGKSFEYEVSGFTFGIADRNQLFTVFDDYSLIENQRYKGVDIYSSYFNQLIIKNNVGILIRVEPTEQIILDQTDSIWYARGNDIPWYHYDSYDEELDESLENLINELEDDSIMEDVEDSEVALEEVVYEDPIEYEGLPMADEIEEKNYYELRDSVEYELKIKYLDEVCTDLFIKNNSLFKSDKNFSDLTSRDSDGVFYLDNSRNLQKDQSFWYMQTVLPGLYNDLKTLYTGNVIVGDIQLHEDRVDMKVTAKYGKDLGTIYEKMNNAKFDKNVLNYIHKDNNAYFTYNVNLREAYEQAYKIIVPILEKENNPQVSTNLLTLELLNEFINKDALFGAYKGSMFGSFNGIQKVKTKKIEFTYDEETFEYQEREVEAEEDMPIFVLGFSTDRSDIPEKVLKHLGRLTSRFKRNANYWEYEEGVLDAASLYFINKNGLFIITNDAELAKNNSDGYGANAIKGKKAKEIKKNGFMYSEIDWGTAINQLPSEVFNGKQREVIEAMRDKSGKLVLTSSKTSIEKTDFNLVYSFDQSYGHSGKYVLDLINSIYILSK